MSLDAPVRLPLAPLLAEGATRAFELALYGRKREAFLLRYDGRLRAFLNECPHWSVELDLGDGHFFDEGLRRIYCKNHGALFSPTSGLCETGPCLGRALTQFVVEEGATEVVVGPGLLTLEDSSRPLDGAGG